MKTQLRKNKKDIKTISQISLLIINVLGVTITFFTLMFLIKQHKTSIQPNLQISDTEYNLFINDYTSENQVGPQHWYFTDENIDTTTLEGFKKKDVRYWRHMNYLRLNMYNIGLGTAKDIKFKWSFDTLNYIEMIKTYKNAFKKDIIDTAYIENGFIKIYSKKDSLFIYDSDRLYKGSRKINKEYYFCMPYRDKSNIFKVQLPQLYIELFTFVHTLEFRYMIDNSVFGWADFPKLHLNISYKDISDNEFNDLFTILLTTRGPSGSLESVKIKGEISVQKER